jgi:hypothetical protein
VIAKLNVIVHKDTLTKVERRTARTVAVVAPFFVLKAIPGIIPKKVLSTMSAFLTVVHALDEALDAVPLVMSAHTKLSNLNVQVFPLQKQQNVAIKELRSNAEYWQSRVRALEHSLAARTREGGALVLRLGCSARIVVRVWLGKILLAFLPSRTMIAGGCVLHMVRFFRVVECEMILTCLTPEIRAVKRHGRHPTVEKKKESDSSSRNGDAGKDDIWFFSPWQRKSPVTEAAAENLLNVVDPKTESLSISVSEKNTTIIWWNK